MFITRFYPNVTRIPVFSVYFCKCGLSLPQILPDKSATSVQF